MNEKSVSQELQLLVKELKQMIRQNSDEPALYNYLGDIYLALYQITGEKIYFGAAAITYEESFKIDGNSIAQDGLQKAEKERLSCRNRRPESGKTESSSQMKTNNKLKIHNGPQPTQLYYEDWEDNCWIDEEGVERALLLDELSSDEMYNYYFGDDDWADIQPQDNRY